MKATDGPAAGLVIYCTDCNPVGYYTYDGNWKALGSISNPYAGFSGGTLLCLGALSRPVSTHKLHKGEKPICFVSASQGGTDILSE